jgi:hypothetical protein
MNPTTKLSQDIKLKPRHHIAGYLMTHAQVLEALTKATHSEAVCYITTTCQFDELNADHVVDLALRPSAVGFGFPISQGGPTVEETMDEIRLALFLAQGAKHHVEFKLERRHGQLTVHGSITAKTFFRARLHNLVDKLLK